MSDSSTDSEKHGRFRKLGQKLKTFLFKEPEILMTYTDEPAINVGVKSELLPRVKMAPGEFELQRSLGAEEYLSTDLLLALETRVDWTGKHKQRNDKDFTMFAHELNSFQNRGDTYQVRAYKREFSINNLTREFVYRQIFF